MKTKNWNDGLPKYYQRKIAETGLNQAHMTRRTALKGMAATGVAAGATAMMPLNASATASFNYMCWEGYNDPEIIAPFEAANDVDLNFDLIVDSPGGFAKLAAGAHREFDLISTDSPWVLRMGPAGLCEFLDPADFTDEYASFYPQFQHPFPPLMHDGQVTGIPTRWGWLGIPLNLEYSREEDWKSYAPCFDKKNRDKIGVMDWGDWPILPMALYAGIDPYKELDKNELNEIRLVLRALFKNTRAFFGDLSVAQKALLDGSVKTLVGTGSYATSAIRKAGHKKIVTITPEPKDGLNQGIIWLEGTAIVKDPNEPELAKKLIKHLVSPDVALKLSWTDFTCNPTPIATLEDIYTDEQKEVLQTDYMWEAWDRSVFHEVAPNVDDMLAIWQEELTRAA